MLKRLNNRAARAELRRRDYVAGSGALGLTLVAGCLGDDDDAINDGDDGEDHDDDDDVVAADDDDDDDVIEADDDDGDDTADHADDADEIERHDVVPTLTSGTPVPADAQYAAGWNGESIPSWVSSGRHQYSLMGRSFGDMEFYGEMIEDWTYQPGILEVQLRDDMYWWSGKLVDAHDLTAQFDLEDYAYGGEDLDSQPNIIAQETIDDQTVRLSLADTWREEWALQQTLNRETIHSSTDFTGPWIEEFEDTGGDMDAVEEIRGDLGEYRVESDEEVVHQFHIPFEFRKDGEYGEVGSDFWELELVPEKNGEKRAFVDDINFTGLRFPAMEESDIHRQENFEAGIEVIMSDVPDWRDEIPYATKVIEFTREFDRWGWNMNAEAHPTDNPHFRRAWNFATRRSEFEQRGERLRIPPERGGHPFQGDDRLYRWVSDDLIESFTDYGMEAEWDRAEEELAIGGFEQNGDGEWLNQETGEPIDIDIPVGSGLDMITDLGSDWFSDINDFGIGAEQVDGDDPWRVEAEYVGGMIPEWVFDTIWGEDDLSWTAQNPNFEESVMAPALGETDAPSDDWVQYDTRAMTDRLGVTTDDDAYQSAVDELAWCANQLIPRCIVVSSIRTEMVNDEKWHVPEPADVPEKYLMQPMDRMWYNGLLSYVPEEDR